MLKVSYDGTNYSGWQIQENAITVEEKITEAIYLLTGERVKVIGSGRTDKGVHAYKQVCNFKTKSKISPSKFYYHLKKYLPDDIDVFYSKEVDMDFNSRFSAKSKTYIYKIMNTEYMSPIYRNYYAQIDYKLDFQKMKEASSEFIGRKDFTSFTKALEENINPVRNILDLSLYKKDKIIYIKITGESFLRNMVRIIAGCLVEVGRGKIKKEEIPLIFAKKSKVCWSYTNWIWSLSI